MDPRVTERARNLPHAPGVYLFKDAAGVVIYAGKAANLRKRITSYLKSGGDGRLQIPFLEREAGDLDFVVTETEQEAVLLENTLIKKFKPKHNVRLKDDKSYLLLRLDPAERWPWFRLVRRRRADGALYFGPFSSASAVRRTLKLLHKVVPLRDCTDGVFHNRSRPCLKHQIGRCPAPCVDYIDHDGYLGLVTKALEILRGNTKDLERELTARMAEAAADLRYEVAQAAKENLDALHLITERQRVVEGTVRDRDVIGCFSDGDHFHIAVLSYRDMGLEASRVHRLATALPIEELLSQVVSQLYYGDRYVPSQILLPAEPTDRDALEGWLRARRGARVELAVPQRGDKRRTVEMASRNAELAGTAFARGEGRIEDELDELQHLLQLPVSPRRIHCLDVSTIQGRNTVASRVCLLEGWPHPAEYRRFRVRGDDALDDFSSMQQVVARSIGLCLRQEGEEVPDLLLIDGGKGQLTAARKGLTECGLGEELPVAALAKDKQDKGERVFLPEKPMPVPLVPGSAPWRLLTRVRDEAHRFAITYHRQVRERIGSELDMIPGLGPRRRQALLKHFGSVGGVREATLEELVRVPGLPLRVAEAVFESYREE